MTEYAPFLAANSGFLKGIKDWQDLDRLWATLAEHNDGNWYIYTVEDEPPVTTTPRDELSRFVKQLDRQLREQHEEDYCGIVYCDDPDNPAFIKVYDPNNLGVVCGFSDNPPLPGWILTRHLPCSLQPAEPASMWRKLLHKFS